MGSSFPNSVNTKQTQTIISWSSEVLSGMAKEFSGGTWSGRGRAKRGRRRGARSRRRPRRPWIGRQAGYCQIHEKKIIFLSRRSSQKLVVSSETNHHQSSIITVLTPAWIFIYRRRGPGCWGRVVEHLVIGWWTPLSGSAGPTTLLHNFSAHFFLLW